MTLLICLLRNKNFKFSHQNFFNQIFLRGRFLTGARESSSACACCIGWEFDEELLVLALFSTLLALVVDDEVVGVERADDDVGQTIDWEGCEAQISEEEALKIC